MKSPLAAAEPPGRSNRRRPWRRRLRWAVAAAVVLPVLAGWVGAEVMLRPRLARAPVDLDVTPADLGWAYEDLAVAAADGATVRGWFIPHAGAEGRTLIVLHGFGDQKHCLLNRAARLRRTVAANLLLLDLRGHGDSGGTVSFGRDETADLRAVVDALSARADVPPGKIAVLGASLGGAVAIRAAAEDPRLCAVVAEGAYASLPEAVADRAARWWVPAPVVWAARAAFRLRAGFDWADCDPAADAARLRRPLLLLHGEADDQTPPRHSLRIAEAAANAGPGRASLWLVPGGGHVGLDRAGGAEYRRRVGDFLRSAWGRYDGADEPAAPHQGSP
jgi:pimeloyl-ACP methyl ester carboxylesterase